ncbi:transcriptional regulator with XRE-family HTH domain [Pedobacter sp. CAN_A7]|uniref:helix-turn-helix domain-containing protein n=1 Tax=Pedobacter sp. CAN_A7 TaxID=2787722 RepID=UPI0018C9F440
MNNLGERIKHYRHKKEWSQSIAANLLGISIPAFSKIETNITIVTIVRLRQIADVLEVPINILLGDVFGNKHNTEIAALEKSLTEQASRLLALRYKIIALHDELQEIKSNKFMDKQVAHPNVDSDLSFTDLLIGNINSGLSLINL